MGIRVSIAGPIPGGGLIVANHLGYVDILVLAAAAPTVFVAKAEVRSWPVFGWFARRSGTIFAERGRAASAARSNLEMAAALRTSGRVVLFPEGTSSGGETVLPFKSALLETAQGRPVWVAALHYSLSPGEGDPAEEVCYWKDMSLPPHLLRLLGQPRIFATLVFSPEPEMGAERKTLARRLQARVLELKDQAARLAPPGAGERRRRRHGPIPTAWRGPAPQG